jgi:hypothetical protein
VKLSPLKYGWVRYLYGKTYTNMRIELVTKSNENATYGDGTVFNDDDNPMFYFKTLELPWKDNQRMISCILPAPGGTLDYLVHKMKPTPKRPYEYFHVQNVKGRSGILWHPGNYTRQILGCILPGESHIDLDKDGTVDITQTTHTLKILTSLMPDKFKLTIIRT